MQIYVLSPEAICAHKNCSLSKNDQKKISALTTKNSREKALILSVDGPNLALAFSYFCFHLCLVKMECGKFCGFAKGF
jgi:hypothetical protein